MPTTQPRSGQFTNHTMSAWLVVLHCQVVHDNFFLRKLVYAST
jgi:hypothetical protein